MQCDEFERRLNEALDARRDPSDDRLLSLHAQHCRGCRNLAATMEVIGESLRWAQQPEPDEQLAETVLARVASPTPASHSKGSWSVWTHATLAAAVALLVALTLPRQHEAMPDGGFAAATPQQEQLAQVEHMGVPAQPVGQLAREATARYATLARNTSESFSGVLSLWQPSATEEGTGDEAQREPMLAEVAAGLRPLADCTTGAVRFLFDVLPQDGARDQGQRAEGI
jgi:hypothetical protein